MVAIFSGFKCISRRLSGTGHCPCEVGLTSFIQSYNLQRSEVEDSIIFSHGDCELLASPLYPELSFTVIKALSEKHFILTGASIPLVGSTSIIPTIACIKFHFSSQHTYYLISHSKNLTFFNQEKSRSGWNFLSFLLTFLL